MVWANITVEEGATTSAAIFNNLFGILSRPTDFFSSIDINNLQTVAIVGVCIEKVLFLRVRYDSGVNLGMISHLQGLYQRQMVKC